MQLRADDSLAVDVVAAIRGGDIPRLASLLEGQPRLAQATIVDDESVGRSLLHVVTDWPGHFPRCAETIAVLVAAGADCDRGVADSPHGAPETPLHWAASCDDVDAIEALLDAGANIEAPGAIFTGGTAMSDAVVFAQWQAARKLLARGASTTLSQSAALGLLHRLRDAFAARTFTPAEVTAALWHACRGGQQPAAEYLRARGADRDWVGFRDWTPLRAAEESGNADLVAFLRQPKGTAQ